MAYKQSDCETAKLARQRSLRDSEACETAKHATVIGVKGVNMKSTIANYDTYSEIENDISSLKAGQIISCTETMRLYRIESDKAITPITNGANFELVGTTLTITY